MRHRVNDTITLTIPTSPAYRGVATLVLGGVGSRLDLPYERTDDLQLAVLSLLDATKAGQAAIEISAHDGRVEVSVGPLRDDAESDDGLTLVLRRLADGVEPRRRGDDVWLTVYVERDESGGEPQPPSSAT
jgi:anti-sigma regulatory factor (Ser/Thr protein kinase)